MGGFNSLRNRLVLLIIGITAGAIGFVYLYVVPQLESSLTAEKLRRLERVAEEQAPRLARALEEETSETQIDDLVQSISQQTESRVTLLAVQVERGSQAPTFVIADSQAEPAAIQPRYDVAAAGLERDSVISGVETVAGERSGATAVPISAGSD